MSRTDDAAIKRSRVVLVLIFALFALPLTIAWVMNFATDWMPRATSNHGELIEPVRPFDPGVLVSLDGDPLEAERFAGKWTLVYLQAGDCGDACLNTLYTLRQVRLAQGKNIDRVRRLAILDSRTVPAWTAEAREHYPGLLMARPGSDRALQPFPDVNRIYILDPMGNLMMQYPLDLEPDGMIGDLERLLRISYVG